MKWKAKPHPQKGDIKFKKSFAFLPTKTDDRYWVWLEFYCKELVYSVGSGPGGYLSRYITNRKYSIQSVNNLKK